MHGCHFGDPGQRGERDDCRCIDGPVNDPFACLTRCLYNMGGCVGPFPFGSHWRFGRPPKAAPSQVWYPAQ